MKGVAPDRLLVFAKEPRPGAVKTRLARDLGSRAAARVYRRLAEAEIRGTAPRCDAAGRPEYLQVFCYAPPTARTAVETWLRPLAAPGALFLPQRGADLGERLAQAFERCFALGTRRAAVVGSDVPACTRDHVHAAFEALATHQLVLGPTHDGGYYLLALDRPRPELFAGVAWSTPQVLPQTLARAAAAGLRVARLETLRDVDTLADLAEYGLAGLRASRGGAKVSSARPKEERRWPLDPAEGRTARQRGGVRRR